MFLLYYLVFRSRKCLEKILLMSGLVFLGFLDWLSGKTACEKFSLSLLFFGVLFLLCGFLEGFGARASRSGDVLGWFWVCVSIWILYQIQGVLSAVFGFRRCFFALSLPPFLSPPPLLGAGLGSPSSSFSAPGCRTPDYRYLHRRELIAAHVFLFLLFLPGSAARPLSSSLLLPSLSLFLSLSLLSLLSLSLACTSCLPIILEQCPTDTWEMSAYEHPCYAPKVGVRSLSFLHASCTPRLRISITGACNIDFGGLPNDVCVFFPEVCVV